LIYPRIIPALLLSGKGLVKGIQFENYKYIGDPINAVKIFSEKEADELLLLDVSATAEQRIMQIETVERIADECYMPFAVGGGIRTVDDAARLIRAGAEKVCLNTFASENPQLVKDISDRFGRQSVVVSIDVRKDNDSYRVYTHSGRCPSERPLIEFIAAIEHMGAGELLITSIDREGSMQGYDLNLLRMVTDVAHIPVIAGGGAGCLADFVLASRDAHAAAVSAGSLFVFHGRRRGILINYPSRPEINRLFSQQP
jgi:cyclase